MAIQDLTRTDLLSEKAIKTLVNHPSLPQLVPNLPTRTLTHLIASLGIEDAGPIVAHTTTRQLQRVFDETLWHNLDGGARTRMSSAAFLQWLDVLVDQGESFAAERLEALGLQFVTAQFAELVEAWDPQDTLTRIDDMAELIGNHVVVGKHPEHWDTLRTVMVSLDCDAPAFLQAMLSSLASSINAAGNDRRATYAAVDEAHDRDERRADDGYVTESFAREFLATARTRPLAELAAMDDYEAAVKRYLTSASANTKSESDSAQIDELAELQSILAATQPNQRTLRLEHEHARALPIKELLDQLDASNPTQFAERLNELVFLGNVLVAGSTDQSEPFTELEAANAVLSAANLGSAWLVSQADTTIDDLLAAPPGLIRAFSVGWYILHQIAQRTTAALKATLQQPDIRARLLEKSWLLEEVNLALTDFTNKVDLGDYEEARDNLAIMSLALDPEAHERLRLLIAEFPRLPLDTIAGERVRVSSRHFDNLDDLQIVDNYLRRLPEQIRL